MTNPFHPDLRLAARLIPRFDVTARTLPVLRRLVRVAPKPRLRDVTASDVMVPGLGAAPAVRVRVYRPTSLAGTLPALLWIHGGGYVLGKPETDDLLCAANARDLGIVVASVDYRLAPEHPFPAALEDCHAALRWLVAQSPGERIAIGGASAGGGLAGALAQVALDRAEIRPVLQLLVYPMLDDRTATREDVDGATHRLWTQRSNVLGWSSYLGQAPGAKDAPKQAVPARREDLSGLPRAWLGVGTCDLFHDENVEYARRLRAAGVRCDVAVVPGAFHGFDAIRPGAAVSRDFREQYVAALRDALFG